LQLWNSLLRAIGQIDRHSYRHDKSVPEFDDAGPIVFMDANCLLCSTGARLIARYDRRREFRICPVQSALGGALLRHYGLDPLNPESWLFLAEGRAYTSLDAMIRVGRRIGGAGNLLQLFRLLPRAAQDWLYRRIARNRYALFGKADMCSLPDPDPDPDPELRARLMQ
jgi:predicted DCC family thiol-disulfide oxidoreductase YuxK